MHERRLELLEPHIGDMNVAYYRPILKQLSFEVSEIYVSMLELVTTKNTLPAQYKEVTTKKINTM